MPNVGNLGIVQTANRHCINIVKTHRIFQTIDQIEHRLSPISPFHRGLTVLINKKITQNGFDPYFRKC